MMEQKLIEVFSRIHGTRPFEADAEIVPFGDVNLLVSTDSFSESEDFLCGLDPEAAGRLMAYGAISDILACGAKPDFLVQAWNIDRFHDRKFYERVAQGVQSVVSHYEAKVIGGDVGIANEWCWTATVFASAPSPVRRIAAKRVGFNLYVTGCLGVANTAVFLGHPVPVPVFRRPVPGNSLFATDTSGGLFDALENIRRANEGVWLDVDAERAIAQEAVHGLPRGVEPCWSLVGGVGEYELLFALPLGEHIDGAIMVGRGGFCDSDCECSISISCGGKKGRMTAPPPDYRAIARKDWLTATAEYWDSIGL